MPQTPEVVRRRRTAAARVPLVAARADAVPVLEQLMSESFLRTRKHSDCVFHLRAEGGPRARVARVMRDGHLIAAN